MSTVRRPPRVAAVFTALACAAGLLVLTAPGAASVPQVAATGEMALVQAVPGTRVTVLVDGEEVGAGVRGRTVVGPLQVASGRHTVEFRGDGSAVRAEVTVAAGGNSDVVLHRPASVDEDPVISVYATPDEPIAPGRSRVLLAHTALVPPADVELDGRTVFTNIANGEFATADVPAGEHRASLVLSGEGTTLLGPLPLDLGARTATMIYAVGDPQAGSMDVVARTVRLRRDGTVAPTTVDTGSAGLAAGLPVRPFGPVSPGPSSAP